jgi:hypothetical protein
MKKQILSKIPICGNRQLWILIGDHGGVPNVELRLYYINSAGKALPTKAGFEIPISRTSDLQRPLSELIAMSNKSDRGATLPRQ